MAKWDETRVFSNGDRKGLQVWPIRLRHYYGEDFPHSPVSLYSGCLCDCQTPRDAVLLVAAVGFETLRRANDILIQTGGFGVPQCHVYLTLI
jgi:hypothetical protein